MPSMAGNPTRLLLPEKEIEGDCQGTVDFVFCRIGEPVTLKLTHSESAFDLSNPPFQPLAISERHHLLFLAHTQGFLVANTKDVIGLAKGGEGKDTCVQRSSVVDVQIGRVSILAVSWDNSMLAATVGGEIHLFYVQSLLEKVQEPAISCPFGKSGVVRDLKWRRSSENSFIVLSSDGLLCHGSADLQLKDVMDNVDAVDWSVDGKFVAIARRDTVTILSSNFEEKLGIPLLFQSWDVDSGSEIKVDSIKWVRHDSIVIGCTQLKEDGDEDGYLVQVIASGEHKFTEVSCKPVVFSFPDLFEGLSVDMLPTGAGPYLLANYLDCWDVAITSNKKNVDQHISLLRWLVEDNRYEVVSLELGSDRYIPRIDLQDDGDDNLILGLAVDKSSLYENIKIQSDMEFKELSPRCILLCLTCDGKLTLYHAAWVSEPSDLPKLVSPHGDNIVNEGFRTVSSAESELEVTTSRLKDGLDAASSDKMHLIPGGEMGSRGTLDGAEPCSQGPGLITSSYSKRPSMEEPRMPSNAGDLGTKSAVYEMASDSLMPKGTGTGKIVGSGITVGSTFGSRTAQKPFGVDGSNTSASSDAKGTGTSWSLGSTIIEGSSSWSQTVMPFAVDAADAKHFLSSPGESNSTGIGNKVLFSPPSNSPANFPPFSKPFGTLASSEKINQSGVQASSAKSGYTGSASILHSSSAAALAKLPGSRQQLLANSTSSKPRQRLESEPQFSKQFYNMKDMVKELDALLSSIECEGGFKDVCTVFQEQSLLALEAGLDDLSEVLFVYRDKIENQRMEIQQLCNKMLEVSARQVYMKGIVQQASDHRYWAFWNRQKLSPEFEAKRLNISNLKQNLTNQLMELERHFNSLEINRFGEYDTTTTGWRAPCSSAPSRQTQSLHSVYNTVNSQLAAAEQLSECLSKQMAVLNISSPPSEKRNITKELFESIGLDPKTETSMSPDLKSHKPLPHSFKRTSLTSATALKEQLWNCAPNAVKAFEIESVRRKRDSLDESWAHFEPLRTTIKRISKKEQVRSNLDIAFREAKEVFDSQVKAFDIAQRAGMSNFSSASSEAFHSQTQAFGNSQVKFFDIAQKAGMSYFSRASSEAFDSQTQAFDIAKQSSSGAASSLSKTTFSNSQSLAQFPSKGKQEKPSKKAMDAQSKPIFKWAKDPSEPNTNWSSTSSQVFQSAGTQPSSFAAPSIFSSSSSNKDEKFGSPFMLNMGASSTLNNSSSAATKTALVSKPASFSTLMKLSSTVSPLKTASAAEARIQLNQGTSVKNEVDALASSAQESTKKPTVLSRTLSASIAQATGSSTSSSLSSFQFGNSMQPNIFLSSSKSNAPSSFSNELNSKSMPSLPRVNASEDLSMNKIGSESEHATSQSTNNAAVGGPAKELSSLPSKISSELTTETSQTSVSDMFLPKKDVGLHLFASDNLGTYDTNDSKLQQITSATPATTITPPLREESSLPSTTNESVLPAASGFLTEAESAMAMSSSIMTTEKDESLDANLSQEDDMEEEALDTNSMLNLESLGGFSLQSTTPTSNSQRPNPFGSSFLPTSTGSASPQFSWSVSPGQLFRPSSFNLPESQTPQSSQSTGSGSLTGGLSGGFSGFGQPAQLGAGQQALGSVLGSFGQSRQLGTGSTGFGFASAAGSSGGFANSGGFPGAATGGGFSGASSNIGGFATGGFGGFSSIQGSGFSGFGAGNSSAGRPPAELFTQMRK